MTEKVYPVKRDREYTERRFKRRLKTAFLVVFPELKTNHAAMMRLDYAVTRFVPQEYTEESNKKWYKAAKRAIEDHMKLDLGEGEYLDNGRFY